MLLEARLLWMLMLPGGRRRLQRRLLRAQRAECLRQALEALQALRSLRLLQLQRLQLPECRSLLQRQRQLQLQRLPGVAGLQLCLQQALQQQQLQQSQASALRPWQQLQQP
jgi:hypothetical protein